jgi:regulator of protease activity HflC (stomatin/prohibitin superfamily)
VLPSPHPHSVDPGRVKKEVQHSTSGAYVPVVCVVPVMVIALYIFSSVKILRGYERGVVFRLGRVLAVPRGPGIALVFAPVDRMVRMLLRASRM